MDSVMTCATHNDITRGSIPKREHLRTPCLAPALASCAVAFAGCGPGTVVRYALTDLLTAEPGPLKPLADALHANVDRVPSIAHERHQLRRSIPGVRVPTLPDAWVDLHGYSVIGQRPVERLLGSIDVPA